MSIYDDKGRLTRAGAVQAINAGGSVLLDGKSYTSVDKLPGESTFAKGNKAAEDAARQRLLAARADTDRQLKELEASQAKADEGTPDGLDDLTNVQLKERVDAEGLTVHGQHNKANLLAALREKQRPAPGPTA